MAKANKRKQEKADKAASKMQKITIGDVAAFSSSSSAHTTTRTSFVSAAATLPIVSTPVTVSAAGLIPPTYVQPAFDINGFGGPSLNILEIYSASGFGVVLFFIRNLRFHITHDL